MAKSRKRQNGETPAPDVLEQNDVSAASGASGPDANQHRNDETRVAMRAYELYLARGGADGADFDDWLTAERELASRRDDLRRD